MAGRSLHRSQDMGQIQGLGASVTRLALVEAAGADATADVPADGDRDGGGADELFAGVDTTLGPGLARYAALIDSARALLTPRDPAPRPARCLAGGAGGAARAAAPAAAFRAAKEPLLAEAIAAAAGVVVDAYAGEGPLVAGQGVPVTATGLGRGRGAGRRWTRSPSRRRAAGPSRTGRARRPRDGVPAVFAVQAGERGEPPVHAHGARRRRAHASRTSWRGRGSARCTTGPASRTTCAARPSDPPLVDGALRPHRRRRRARRCEREVAYRYNDQASGEVRKPLVVVPAVGVSVSPDLLVWPLGARGRADGHGRADARGAGRHQRHAAPRGAGRLARGAVAGRSRSRAPDAQRSFTFLVRAPRDLAAGSAHHPGGRRGGRAALRPRRRRGGLPAHPARRSTCARRRCASRRRRSCCRGWRASATCAAPRTACRRRCRRSACRVHVLSAGGPRARRPVAVRPRDRGEPCLRDGPGAGREQRPPARLRAGRRPRHRAVPAVPVRHAAASRRSR